MRHIDADGPGSPLPDYGLEAILGTQPDLDQEYLDSVCEEFALSPAKAAPLPWQAPSPIRPAALIPSQGKPSK